jgi:hypothetical protein
MSCDKRRKLFPFLLCMAVACPRPLVLAAPQQIEASPGASGESSPTLTDIVRQLDSRNRDRAVALLKFEGTRIYRMHYEGFLGTRDAEMVVGVKASSDERQFLIESQTGSKFIVDHIFKKLLEGEKEAATDAHRQRTALNADNYNFTLAGFDATSGSPAYILNVIPKTDEKFLYRGKIWVDAKDFAVIRIEAEPAKSPSVWVKKAEIRHTYKKIDEFWLPVENRTESSIRFGGHALLSIEYTDYKITESRDPNLNLPASSGCDSVRGARQKTQLCTAHRGLLEKYQVGRSFSKALPSQRVERPS